MNNRAAKVVVTKHAIERYQKRINGLPEHVVKPMLAQCYYTSQHAPKNTRDPDWWHKRIGLDASGRKIVLCWRRDKKGRITITTVLPMTALEAYEDGTATQQWEPEDRSKRRARRL